MTIGITGTFDTQLIRTRKAIISKTFLLQLRTSNCVTSQHRCLRHIWNWINGVLWKTYNCKPKLKILFGLMFQNVFVFRWKTQYTSKAVSQSLVSSDTKKTDLNKISRYNSHNKMNWNKHNCTEYIWSM